MLYSFLHDFASLYSFQSDYAPLYSFLHDFASPNSFLSDYARYIVFWVISPRYNYSFLSDFAPFSVPQRAQKQGPTGPCFFDWKRPGGPCFCWKMSKVPACFWKMWKRGPCFLNPEWITVWDTHIWVPIWSSIALRAVELFDIEIFESLSVPCPLGVMWP